MSEIVKKWAGSVRGTNTGKLYIEFEQDGQRLGGYLRLMDDSFGLVVYEISGSFTDKFELTGKPVQARSGLELGELSLEATLNSQGLMNGTWKTSIGAAGTFNAFPQDFEVNNLSPTSAPEQIYTKNISLGAIRLFREDVLNLLNHVKQDFNFNKVVVAYNANGSEVSQYEEAFLRDSESLGTLDYLKIQIQEHEAHGINRVVVVELRAYGESEVRVQGIQESWVVGKAETLASILKNHQNTLVTTYKKFGLNLNQFIFIGMLVFMPSIKTWLERTIFAGSVFILLTILLWFHSRFIPNAVIKMTEGKPGWLSRTWPSLASWIGGVIATIIAGLILYWLTERG